MDRNTILGSRVPGRQCIVAAIALLMACSASGQRQQAPTITEPDPRPTAAPGFKGATGFGAKSQGGRGGRIIKVTTLADTGPGSLRACIDASGPRVCVFAVSGLIRFATRPPIIRNPQITIAGQTAPGEGVTLAHGGPVGGRTPLIIKDTSDVIVQHIRIRNDRFGENRGSEDSITIENSSFVIIDHVSASWARDELINGYADNDYVTISNSIFAFGIPKHDKCALLGSDPTDRQHMSFIGNLCAFNGDRNPDVNFPPDSCVEVINNVFYDAQSEFAEVWESYGGTPVSIIGNSFVAGHDTHPDTVGIARQVIGSKGRSSIYMKDNVFSGNFVHVSTLASEVERTTPPCTLTIVPEVAGRAYTRVLDAAGAWPRDAIDAQVVRDVKDRSGSIVRVPGTIPVFRPAAPYPDRDGDGMDDAWESRNRMNLNVADSWGDVDGDGVSNFNAFLFAIDKTPRGPV